MNSQSQQLLQIFIDASELQFPTRALTLNPHLIIRNLKSSLFPKFQTLDSLYFTFNGRPVSDVATLRDSRITPFSTLILHHRLLGGGGDGGATGAESRDCYLNMYATKKPDKVDPNEQRLSKWLNCALSNEPLKHPVVVDKLGNLFNKEALVEGLLAKKLPKAFGHIKGLRDMIAVELAAIPGLESGRNDDFIGKTRFHCPITGLEFNGKYKFFALRACGHVLSAKALKEVKSSACLVCHKEFLENDMIVINGNEEEVVVLRERMEEEKVKLREKKTKKAKNGDVGVNGVEDGCVESGHLSGRKHAIEVKAVEKASVRVEGYEHIVKGGTAAKSANGSVKRFKAADMAPPNATKEVYASIFTSSQKREFKETFTCRSLPLGRN